MGRQQKNLAGRTGFLTLRSAAEDGETAIFSAETLCALLILPCFCLLPPVFAISIDSLGGPHHR